MGTNLVDVREKIDKIDAQILDLLLERMEMMPQVAEAKYALDGEDLKIRRSQREIELFTLYKEKAGHLAKKSGIVDSDIFEELVLKLAKELFFYACKFQQDFLEKEYNLRKEI